jgi:hypothetical protein
MVVDVIARGAELQIGASRPLMPASVRPTGQGLPYVPSPDGQRFLLNTIARDPSSVSLSLVINWPAAIGQ